MGMRGMALGVAVAAAPLAAAQAGDLERLPLIRDGIQTRQFSAYDRAGDNYDWEYFPLYVEPNGECVIFDAFGPGCLYRHHMNVWNGGRFGPSGFVPDPLEKDLRIRYYFDDEAKPRIDMDITTFFSAANPLGIFQAPLAVDGKERFRLLYHPMPFRKRLKVALSRVPGGASKNPVTYEGRYDAVPQTRYSWYQYTYQVFKEDPGVPSWTPEAAKGAMPGLQKGWSDLGADPKPTKGNRAVSGTSAVPPKGSAALLRLDGSEVISSLRLQVMPATNPAAAFDTWIRITFDGAAQPQIHAPIGSFFGGYRTDPWSAFSSLLLGTSPLGGYCFLPMPFWKSAVVEVENRTDAPVTVAIQAERKPNPFPADAAGHLFAKFNREDPRTEGRDYLYLSTKGAGHVVGHVTARWGTAMEENERTYFDGSATPSIFGNGFEDDHGMGWGLQNLIQPVFGAHAARDGEGGIYRWYVPDTYHFANGIRHGHQTYGPNSPRGHEGLYGVGKEESVTFYYAQSAPRLVETDTVDIGDSRSESEHGYRASVDARRTSGAYWYDGDENNVLRPVPAIEDQGVAFKGASEFRVAIDPRNRGIRLRRRTDKENNRQRARVFVDGRLVSERPWYSVDYERTYRNIRWLDSDFDVPAKYTKGKASVRLRIEFESSETGVWDEYRYWVFSYV